MFVLILTFITLSIVSLARFGLLAAKLVPQVTCAHLPPAVDIHWPRGGPTERDLEGLRNPACSNTLPDFEALRKQQQFGGLATLVNDSF